MQLPGGLGLEDLLSGHAALVLGFVVTLAVIIYGFHPLKRWRYRHIPGPPFRWLVGGLPEFAMQGPEHAYAAWAEQYAIPHGVFKVFIGATPQVVVVDPNLSRKALKGSARRPEFPLVHTTQLERDMAGHHMLLQNGEPWRESRNAWTPFFTSAKMKAYFPTMLCCADELAEAVGARADVGDVFDVWPLLGNMTLDVIATVAGGLDIATPAEQLGLSAAPGATLSDVLSPLIRAEFATFDVNAGMALRLVLPECKALAVLLCRLFPDTTRRKGKAAREFLMNGFFDKLVAAERRPEEAKSSRPSINPESLLASVCQTKQKATGQPFSELWAAMQGYVAILGGTDTTSLLLAYTIYFLAANPDKEAKLLAEVDKFGRDKEPAYEDLVGLPYIAAVLQESLRLLPPGATSPREAKTGLKIGPYHVPEGTWVVVSHYAMQRSERYWRDALAFVPERFIPGTPEAGEANPEGHIPFGDGPRSCPGYRLALQEAALATLRLYQRFTFRLAPGQRPLKVRTSMTLAPVDGIHVTARRRG